MYEFKLVTENGQIIPTRRFERVLAMVYNTQNSGFNPSSGVLETRKHIVSGTRSFSTLKLREGFIFFCWSSRKSSAEMRAETDVVL
jgi:hypothetical protein